MGYWKRVNRDPGLGHRSTSAMHVHVVPDNVPWSVNKRTTFHRVLSTSLLLGHRKDKLREKN